MSVEANILCGIMGMVLWGIFTQSLFLSIGFGIGWSIGMLISWIFEQ